jgi:hypothetical protein
MSRVLFPMVPLTYFWPHYDPRVDLASNWNEYFLGDKGGRCVGESILPPSCVDCFEMRGPRPLLYLQYTFIISVTWTNIQGRGWEFQVFCNYHPWSWVLLSKLNIVIIEVISYVYKTCFSSDLSFTFLIPFSELHFILYIYKNTNISQFYGHNGSITLYAIS